MSSDGKSVVTVIGANGNQDAGSDSRGIPVHGGPFQIFANLYYSPTYINKSMYAELALD